MEKYIISGGRKLDGKVKIESAKNAILPILCASLLIDKGETVIKNCPLITDVINLIKIIQGLGINCQFVENDIVISGKLSSYSVKKEPANLLRSSVLLTGALLGQTGKAIIPYPGGCAIGERPLNIHIDILRCLGAEITQTESGLFCNAKKLCGCKVKLPFPSVGATENMILASVKAKGETIIENSAREPEIVDLANFLNKCGAKIYGAGTDRITICGVKRLYGVQYTPIFDRIEAGTFIIASLITNGEVEISNINSEIISSFIGKICNNTCNYICKDDIIYIKSGSIETCYNISTGPYPFFPTDLQPQMTALSCICSGKSTITENVFEMRFGHVPELKKMGADIKCNGRQIIVGGVKELVGTKVYSHDLRCGASLILAGLVAKGVTTVCGAKFIERGYNNIDQKLLALGADIIGK